MGYDDNGLRITIGVREIRKRRVRERKKLGEDEGGGDLGKRGSELI